MTGWLILVAPVVLWAAFVLVRARFWPYARCPACRERKGRGVGSTDQAYNRCRRCAGRGERIRPRALIYRKWREEAKR